MNTESRIRKYIDDNWDGTLRFVPEDGDTVMGIIGMPYPYSVSGFGNVFQEMYYWGTYFTNLGLILSDRVEQAINNVKNMIYLVDRFGYVPNANRRWGMTRSQPPFLSEMIRNIYEKTHDKSFLADGYRAVETEYEFWQTRRMTPSGLNRYLGENPDTARCCNQYCDRLKIDKPTDEAVLVEYALAFQSGAESGWDFSSRCGLMQHHFNWLCLNSLLFGVEKNMEFFAVELENSESELWRERAEARKTLMNKLMWNEELGAFCDYDFVDKKQADLISLAMLYPLFVGLATKDQAEKTIKNLPALERRYGLASCEEREDLSMLQWDFPHAWPPLQIIAVKALKRYGYESDACRVANKLICVTELNFEKHSRLWEKFNALDGAVSKTKEYETPPIMGWSAAAYLYCKEIVASYGRP